MHIERFEYTVEKAEILDGYLKFAEWSESAGQLYSDWFRDNMGYRNKARICEPSKK